MLAIDALDFAYSHEYAYFVYPTAGRSINARIVPESEWEFSNLRNWGGDSERKFGKSLFYPIYVKDDAIIRLGAAPAEDVHPSQQSVRLANGEIEVWPMDPTGVERKWRYSRDSLTKILHATKVKAAGDRWEILIAKLEDRYKTLWADKQYDASVYGTQLLSDMLASRDFSFPKSINTVQDSIRSVVGNRSNDIVLDFFAGSGTTAPRVRSRVRYSDEQVQQFLLLLRSDSLYLEDLPAVEGVAADPDDDKFLSLALASRANYIVSGDDHLLTIGAYQGIAVITAAVFLEHFTFSAPE